MSFHLALFQLYTAQLFGDFLFQSNWLANHKRNFGALTLHGAIHFICGIVAINVSLSTDAVWTLVALAVSHVAVDLAKAQLRANGWIAFIVDQSVHFVFIVAAATYLSGLSLTRVESALADVLTDQRTYLYSGAYVGIVFGGGYLVQKVTESFLASIGEEIKALKPGLPKAGQYIGWVERALVLSFVLAGFNDAVGFLLAVKALTRYPEIKEDSKGHFAEYFLVGTLTSVGLALAGGMIVNKLTS